MWPVDAAVADGDDDEVAAEAEDERGPVGVQQRQVQQPAGQAPAPGEVRVEILQIVVKLMAPSSTFYKIVTYLIYSGSL